MKSFQQHVAEQAADMVAELKAHAEEKGAPGSWSDGDWREWCRQADAQLMRLREACCRGDEADIRKRAAHACNFVMMAKESTRR
jgi:hypothetical protein